MLTSVCGRDSLCLRDFGRRIGLKLGDVGRPADSLLHKRR
jgi:hypothetical protein